MYSCSWLTNNTQCTNTTNYLVCDSCYLEKDKLYSAYKEAEKTVISAISSAPRGDILEVSKVLGRLSRVIELRKEFTSHLCHQVRDNGHKYHLSKLLQVMLDYKQYLFSLTQHKDDTEEEDNNTETINLCTTTIAEQITTVIEEDPFADFDDVIQEYKNNKLFIDNYIDNMCSKYNITREQSKLVICFYADINWYAYESPKLITHIIKGRFVRTKFRPNYENINIRFINEISSYNIGQEEVNWIISHSSNCKFAVLTYQKKMILCIYTSNNIFTCTYHIQITVSKTDGYNILLTDIKVDTDVMLLIMSVMKTVGYRQKHLFK